MGNRSSYFLNTERARVLVTIDRTPCRIVSDSTDGSCASPAQQAEVQAPLSRAARDQAMAQLSEAKKAIDSLKRLLTNLAQ
jgi:hypothetical protein